MGSDESDYQQILATLEDWEDNIEVLDSNDTEENCGNQEGWSEATIKLLLDVRLGMEDQFQKGEKTRNTLWNIVHKKMLDKKSLTLTAKEIQRKFRNMLVTYNRIKARNKQTGKSAVNWKYFHTFNNVYGTRHNIVPPDGLVFDTSNSTELENSQKTNDKPYADEPNRLSMRGKRRRKNEYDFADLLKYWKEADEEEKKRHEQWMQVESTRYEIDKEKNSIERAKVECLQEVKDILQKIVDNS